MSSKNEWNALLMAALAMAEAIDASHRRILAAEYLTHAGWQRAERGRWRSPHDPALVVNIGEALSSQRKRASLQVCETAKRLVAAAATPPSAIVDEAVARKHLAEELRRTANLLWPDRDSK